MPDKKSNWLSDAVDQASRGANRALTKDNFCKAVTLIDKLDSIGVSLHFINEEYKISKMQYPQKELHFIAKAFLCAAKTFLF